jgi:hypothetical protein
MYRFSGLSSVGSGTMGCPVVGSSGMLLDNAGEEEVVVLVLVGEHMMRMALYTGSRKVVRSFGRFVGSLEPNGV